MNGHIVMACVFAAVILSLTAAVLTLRELRSRSLDRWLITYVRERSRYRDPEADRPIHLLLCIADHFEPKNGGASLDVARGRLRRWIADYPALCGPFRDSDGRPPRHTFFYPIEQYDEVEVDALTEICALGLGEVEIHLHHDDDTSEDLRRTLSDAKELLARRHGLLARHRVTDALSYGFVHGNWALDNSCPDGTRCGVNDEISILHQTGCYADFTLPSAPSPCQTRKINSIYYAIDDPLRPKSHDWGTDVGACEAPGEALMIVQGPLLLDWGRRKWGVIPRIENGCIQGNQPAHISRIRSWLRASVRVGARPDWYFVKLHTHGGPEANQRVLLGKPMEEFHRALARRAAEDPRFRYHYVTAREMYNLARAAEAGWGGSVEDARDYELLFNGGRVGGSAVDPEPDAAGKLEVPLA